MSKRPKSWLKNVLSTQVENDNGEGSELEPILHNHDGIEEHIETEEKFDNNPNNMLFPREDMDKVTLDTVVAVENLIKDRRLVLINNEGLKDQLHVANESINRLKAEVAKQAQIIEEKDKEYSRLEEKLTTKQMSYDQLLEDYKNYQYTSNDEFETLKNQLEKEVNKYKKLDAEFTDYQYKNMQIIKKLEEKIRDLEAENQKVTEQYQKALDEKNLLLETFNDFSERMSFSFSQKAANKQQVPGTSE